MKFSLANVDARLYEERKVTNGNQNDKSIWISRKVDGHGIERTSVSPNKPCKDRIRYNAAPNQQFWFGEMRRKYRDCGVAGVHEQVHEIELDTGLTEWDFQLENGVLTRLDAFSSTSYTFFPGSYIK